MGDEEIAAVTEVLLSGWMGLGPKTAEFEEAFARYIGVPYAVGTNSATSALHLALKLLDIGPGDGVVVPAITFVSTAHAVAYTGAKPVFVDVDERTMNLDFDSIEERVTGLQDVVNVKAVIPVHYGGRPVDIRRLKLETGLQVVEDAAHACGSIFLDKKCGSEGIMGCFSFHAVKNLAMGDGGALVLSDKGMYERAKRLRWCGIDKTTWDRTDDGKTYHWKYTVDELGYKYHMNDLAATIGLCQLKRLDEMNECRARIAQKYSDAFEGEDWILGTPPRDNPEVQSAWHLYWLRVPSRDDMAIYLREKGIITGVHYHPIHLYSCYGHTAPHLLVAERVAKELISLPMHPGLSDADVGEVIGRILEFKRRIP